MRILARIAFRFALVFTVLSVITIFAKDSHKPQELMLFVPVAMVGWTGWFLTRNR